MAKKSTVCVHGGSETHNPAQGLNTPIYTSSAFGYLDTQENIYPRYYNTPNQEVVVQKLCALEQGEAGLLFASGMAAISTPMLALLKSGDHVVLQRNLYGGTHHFVTTELERWGVTYTLVSEPETSQLEAAIKPNTKLIYIETPSNPLLKITDIQAVAQLARQQRIISMIDNTFASPINQNPLALGIDIVMHSGTKYLGGHSDLCFGAIVTSQELRGQIYPTAINLGGSVNAATCALIERSLKTLSLRVKQQNTNAQAIAEFLQDHPGVNNVYYPGLPDHPGHAIAKQQMQGFGGMLSFEPAVEGGAGAEQLMRQLNIITPAISLGGIESLICAPARTSHIKLSTEERQSVGVRDELLRISVGIEDTEDLLKDLEQALAKTTAGQSA
uniref:PLP-dependent aspartate aminotransferase family protein n=1 Tax=Roseihalotalea indica TaxID=2867963 RepID=A0AA49GPV0_9BACT|nr:PLP-dependent aspartate aminotransferase family protein [Tunicatimonas sp. TK19036]